MGWSVTAGWPTRLLPAVARAPDPRDMAQRAARAMLALEGRVAAPRLQATHATLAAWHTTLPAWAPTNFTAVPAAEEARAPRPNVPGAQEATAAERFAWSRLQPSK